MALHRFARLTGSSSSSLLSSTPLTFTAPSSLPSSSTAVGGGVFWLQQRSATKRGGGSTRNNRDSAGRRLGVKKYGGQEVLAGNILVRQRGLEFHPGQHVAVGRDHTLYATQTGYVRYYQAPREGKGQDSSPRHWRKYCGVVLDQTERLPRDEAALGRSRAFKGVDLGQVKRQLEQLKDQVQQQQQ